MATDLTAVHPELRKMWKTFPRMSFNRWNRPLLHGLVKLMPKMKTPEGILVDQAYIPSKDGAHQIRLRLYKPQESVSPAPALVWMHGGGYIIGTPEQDDGRVFELVKALGIVVISVDYRLAPRHPFPAPLEDCYAALEWVHSHPQKLGIDPERIAIAGLSAGGGLAASLVQLAHDRGEIKPVFQLLLSPMLDDRTVLRTGLPHAALLTWNANSNCYGWESYLQQPAGAEQVPAYAVPARREDLSGLPPAWIGVGTLDLFYDENLAYGQRLKDSGVACEVLTLPGVYHGFDALNDQLDVIRQFRAAQTQALKKYLFP